MSTPIVLIGYGYWGQKLARCIEESNYFDLCSIVETNLKLHGQKKFPFFQRLDDAFQSFPQIQAAAIAVPMRQQSALVEQALKKNLHVLVTKTLASNSEQANELIELAMKKNRALFVDYTFLHTQGHKKLKSLIQQEPEIFWPHFIEMRRRALGKFDLSLAVHWDLACHDLSLILDLFPKELLKALQATELTHNYGVSSQVEIILEFETFKVRINSAWDSPKKIREIELLGKYQNIVYSGCYPDEQIQVSHKGHSFDAGREVRYFSQDEKQLEISPIEPLPEMIEEFSKMILSPRKCPTKSYLEIIKILERVDQSLAQDGKKLYL